MPRPFFGILLAECLPQVTKFRGVAAGDVVGDRHARQFDDAAFDRVHQREVAHRPWEQRALRVAGAAQEKGRGGQIVDTRDAELALDGLEPGDPHPGGFVVLLASSFVLALEVGLGLAFGVLDPLAIAVMGLVVHDDDVLHSHQLGHDALEHLPFGLQRL